MRCGAGARSCHCWGPASPSHICTVRYASRQVVVDAAQMQSNLPGSLMGMFYMDELIVILDDLGMLHKLRSDPEEFVRDMFVKYDVNFDGVLSFAEFIGLHNAALDERTRR